MAREEDGTIFLEIHPDIYGDSKDQTATAYAIAYGRGLLSARESPLWQKTVRSEEGIAVSLTLSGDRLVENDREALPKETFPGGPGLLPLLLPGEGRGEGTTSSRQSRFPRDLRDVARNTHR